jgi:CheY-like chemotaxis protein
MTEETSRVPGLLLCDDLIFASRITGTAHSLGLEVKTATTPEALVELVRRDAPQAIIVDLACPGLVLEELLRKVEESCPTMPRIVAYGSHVDTETLRAARAAGCDPVLPRSKFVADLPQELTGWLSGA